MIPLYASQPNEDGNKLANMEWCQVWEPSIGAGVANQGDKQQLIWGYPGVAWNPTVIAKLPRHMMVNPTRMMH